MSVTSRIRSSGDARVRFLRGASLLAEQRWDQALGEFEAALALDPSLSEAHVNLGFLHERAGRLIEAATAYDRATALDPTLHVAFFNLGAVLMKLCAFEPALAVVERAVALKPDDPETLLALANIRRFRNELDEAEAACRQALGLRPDYVNAWINLANVHRAQNRIADALAACDRALELLPDSPPAHVNKAMALLVSGRLAEGWPHGEYRHGLGIEGAGRHSGLPSWSGQESVTGRSVLLHGEQGLGDSIQFGRYIPLVAQRGATVTVEVQPALKRLFAASFPNVAAVLVPGDSAPPCDLHCALGSLPHAFRTEIETIPAKVPYLGVPPECRDRARSILGNRRRPRIGVAWSGSFGHPNDANRSMPFSTFRAMLGGATGAEVFCIKKEMTTADARELAATPSVVNLQPHLGDLADTAGVIEELDLVIAVDTGVAHLAGALGRPVWILLPFSPDWRWLLERGDSPWYPTARLFRQPRAGAWEPVMADVAAGLVAWIAAFVAR